MNLEKYLSLKENTAAELAREIKVSPVLISQWRKGVRPVPAEHCPNIERATEGKVTCEELLPDVDWAFIRNTKPSTRKAA